MATADIGDEETNATVSQVLEFELGDETYCVSIDHVTEIVDMGDVTVVPNSPPHVEGVMDLRGATTTIIAPKRLLAIPDGGEEMRIVVFDPSTFDDDQSVGWVVDSVNEVTRVVEDDVDDSPTDDEYIRGIVKRDGEFVVWLKPRDLQA